MGSRAAGRSRAPLARPSDDVTTGLVRQPLVFPPMDETLEVVEVAANSELEGAFTWLLRIVGLLLVLAGLGPWLP